MATRVGLTTFYMDPLNRPSLKTPSGLPVSSHDRIPTFPDILREHLLIIDPLNSSDITNVTDP